MVFLSPFYPEPPPVLFCCADCALEGDFFEVRHLLESFEAIVDFILSQSSHPLRAELFDVERSHYRAKDHRATHCCLIKSFLTGEISHKAACEGITRARRIEN